MAKKHFYAVSIGKRTGIFESWGECERHTKGFPGAKFKGFRFRDEAQNWLNQQLLDKPKPTILERAKSDPKLKKKIRWIPLTTNTGGWLDCELYNGYTPPWDESLAGYMDNPPPEVSAIERELYVQKTYS